MKMQAGRLHHNMRYKLKKVLLHRVARIYRLRMQARR
jgi:hypothetical protein